MINLHNLNAKFNQAYPAVFGWNTALKRASIYGLFVSLFLGYFKPFHLITLTDDLLRWKVAAQFGLITFCSILVTLGLLPQLFPNTYREDRWVLTHEILFIFFNFGLIGSFNFCYIAYLYGFNASEWWRGFIWMQTGTLSVGAAPVIAFVLYDQNRLLRKNLLKAKELSQQLHEDVISTNSEQAPPILDEQLVFNDENGNTALEIQLTQLLYLQAAGNYLDIYYLEQGQAQKFVLRNRLKHILSTLPRPFMYQCHRSYIVNLNHVTKVSGNARGLLLHFENCDTLIPVSRGKSEEIYALLGD